MPNSAARIDGMGGTSSAFVSPLILRRLGLRGGNGLDRSGPDNDFFLDLLVRGWKGFGGRTPDSEGRLVEVSSFLLCKG